VQDENRNDNVYLLGEIDSKLNDSDRRIDYNSQKLAAVETKLDEVHELLKKIAERR